MSPERLSGTLPLLDLGVESIEAAEILRELEERLQVKIPPTAVFDFPTIDELAKQLAQLGKAIVDKQPH